VCPRILARFWILAAKSVDIILFWDAGPYSQVETDVLRILTASIIRAMMIERVSSSEKSVSFYQTNDAKSQKSQLQISVNFISNQNV
jgi:hypothetical protein